MQCWHKFYAFPCKVPFMLPLPTRYHAIVDYSFSLFLMLAPAIFGFGEAEAETIVPIVAGMTICFYSFFTKYEGGLSPIISIKLHYFFDIVVGLLVALSPWLFGFRQIVYKPHVFIGIAFMLVGGYNLWPLIKFQHLTLV